MSSEALAINKSKLIQWGVVVATVVGIMCLPLSDVFTRELRLFLMLSIAAILIAAFDLMDIMIPSILLPTMYYALNVVPAQTAFASWTQPTCWMIIGAFVLTNALDESKLLNRIAFWIIKHCGGTYNRTLYGIYLVGMVLGIITFCGHYLILISLAYGICRAMKFGKSKESLVIMMVGGIAALNIKLFVYRPSTMAVMVAGVKTVDPTFSVSMTDQMLFNLPSVFIALSFIWLMTRMYKTSQFVLPGGKEYFEEEYKKLGKMSFTEKKAAVMLAVLMLWIVGEPIHHIPADLSFMILPWLCLVPGIEIGTPASFKKINWGLIFFIAACLGIGTVATKLGLSKLLSIHLTYWLSGVNSTLFLYIVLGIGTVANILLSPGAMMGCLPAPVAQLAIDLNMNPLPSLLTIIYSTDMIFLPHEVPAYLVMFGFGLMSMKDFIVLHTAKVLWFFLLFGLIQIPFWGLFNILVLK